MRRSSEKVLCPIFTFSCGTSRSYSTSTLRSIFCQCSPFDIPFMRNCNHNFFIRDHILITEILSIMLYISSSIISISLLHLSKFIFDDLHSFIFVSKNFLQFFNQGHDLIIFFLNLLTLHACKTLKPHVQDCSCLNFA